MSEVLRAEAQSRIALAALLPSVSGSATYTHHFVTNQFAIIRGVDANGPVFEPIQTPFPDFLNGGLSLSQSIVSPRAWYAIGTASRAEDAARLSVSDTKRRLALAAANALIAVVTAERVAELNRSGLTNALMRLALTERKAALGAAHGLDLVRSRQDVETARATLVSGDESLRQAREALGLALAIPEAVSVPPDVSIDGIERDALASCKRHSILAERSDIAALDKRAEVAERSVTDAKLQFSPTVALQSAVSTTTMNTGAQPRTTWNIQGVLSVPIWDGGARYGAMRQGAADAQAARERAQAARRQAEVEVAQAKRGVEVAEARLQVAKRGRDLAFESDDLTRRAYAEGRGTSLELVAAAQALRDAEIGLAMREFDVVRARVLAVLSLATCPY